MPPQIRKCIACMSDMLPAKTFATAGITTSFTEHNPPHSLPNSHSIRQSGEGPTSKHLLPSNHGEEEDADEGSSATVEGEEDDRDGDTEGERDTEVDYEEVYDYGVFEDKEDDDVDGVDDMDEEMTRGENSHERIATDISFSGVFKRKVNTAGVDGLWGWDATIGSYGNSSHAEPNRVPQKKIMDKLLLGAVISLADAAAGKDTNNDKAVSQSCGNTPTPVAEQFDGEAGMEGTANESLTAIESMPDVTEGSQYSQHTCSELGARLQRNERRIRRAERKTQKYETELKYLEHKRRRLIWML